MSVKLRRIVNKDGSTSLYLDIYHLGKRHKEFLKNCKLFKATNPIDREDNKAKLALAKKIAALRSNELESSNYSIVADHKGSIDFIQYFEDYISRYTKKDKRNMQGVCNNFKDFMKIQGIKSIAMKQLNEDVVSSFAEYLIDKSKGEGASSYFARFKKMLKQAIREKAININPALDIVIKREDKVNKDVLSIEEIQILAKTPISNKGVRDAFLFSCFTGLAWVDIRALKWEHINIKTGMLQQPRAKTNVKATMAIHNTALSLLPNKHDSKEEFVFPMYSLKHPEKRISHTAALKTLKGWTAKAGIDKHITWHCSRHSTATNLVIWGQKNKNLNLLYIKDLMGHKTLKYTQLYVRPAEEMMRETINNLPEIDT